MVVDRIRDVIVLDDVITDVHEAMTWIYQPLLSFFFSFFFLSFFSFFLSFFRSFFRKGVMWADVASFADEAS